VISGVVRTITLELNAEVKEEQINKVQSILNEKLGGLKFSEIKTSIGNRVKDIDDDSFKPIVRVFLDSVDKIFKTESSEKTIISGTKNLIKQPEFESVQHFQSIIELIENKDIIIHILETQKSNVSDITITIGHENSDEKFCNYSMISKEYTFGDVKGTLGIMGPKRMEYPRIVAAVQYIADQLSNELKKQI
jgi:heat-inducible transcriptional repressor